MFAIRMVLFCVFGVLTSFFGLDVYQSLILMVLAAVIGITHIFERA